MANRAALQLFGWADGPAEWVLRRAAAASRWPG